MIVNFKELGGGKKELIESFKQVDALFVPPLLKRIKSNNKNYSIEDYIDKVNTNGDILLYLDNNLIVGFAAVYSNDFLTYTAYVPLLFVIPDHSGKGIATKLLTRIKEIAYTKKMKFIRLNTWESNKNAVNLYIRNGYKVLSKENSNVQLVLTL